MKKILSSVFMLSAVLASGQNSCTYVWTDASLKKALTADRFTAVQYVYVSTCGGVKTTEAVVTELDSQHFRVWVGDTKRGVFPMLKAAENHAESEVANDKARSE